MTVREFFKKAAGYMATFLSGVLAVLLFIAGRRSVGNKDEAAGSEGAVFSSGREDFQDEFEKDAEKVREDTRDIIASMHERDVADMYPSVWDSIAGSREQYIRRAGEALERKRGDGSGG